MRTRQMAVAGMFYSDDPTGLGAELDRCYRYAPSGSDYHDPIALVCPHAGYVYSGSTAASAYLTVERGAHYDSVVVIGPNHTGIGPAISVGDFDQWETVSGVVPVDQDVARRLSEKMPECQFDRLAHLTEHSIEVQLPFLQRRLAPGFRLTAIVVGLRADEAGLDLCLQLGNAIAEALDGRGALIVASTDMSHYIGSEDARQKDQIAIDAILRLDSAELVSEVRRLRISMCGVMPTVAAMRAAASRGAKRGVLTAYTNSGEVTGDTTQVVSYAAMALVA